MPDKVMRTSAKILARRRSMASPAPSSREHREADGSAPFLASSVTTYRFLIGVPTDSGFMGSSLCIDERGLQRARDNPDQSTTALDQAGYPATRRDCQRVVIRASKHRRRFCSRPTCHHRHRGQCGANSTKYRVHPLRRKPFLVRAGPAHTAATRIPCFVCGTHADG